MVETDIHSQEFQDEFREVLRKSAPNILETIKLLEVNGLKVDGYALLPGGEVVLDVGISPKVDERFKPAFVLRANPHSYPFKWDFAAYAHMNDLPQDIIDLMDQNRRS